MVHMNSKTLQFLNTVFEVMLKQISAMIAAFIHMLLTLVVILQDVLGGKSVKVVILDDSTEDIIFADQT